MDQLQNNGSAQYGRNKVFALIDNSIFCAIFVSDIKKEKYGNSRQSFDEQAYKVLQRNEFVHSLAAEAAERQIPE